MSTSSTSAPRPAGTRRAAASCTAETQVRMPFAVAARAHAVFEARMVGGIRRRRCGAGISSTTTPRGLARQLLQDHRDGGRGSLVARPAAAARCCAGRHEVDAVAHTRSARWSGRGSAPSSPTRGTCDPRGCRTLHVVRDHVDVDLVDVVADLPRRVGPERRALILGHLSPLGVPVVACGHRVEADRRGREDDLHPLVEPGIAVFGEVGRRRT